MELKFLKNTLMKMEIQKSPYSMDANFFISLYEGLHLENPNNEPEESMWLWTTAP